MAAKQCPSCGLKSPVKTMVCDCGRSFVDGAMTEQRKYLPGKDPRTQNANGLLAVGLFVGGWVVAIVGRVVGSEAPTAGSLVYGLGGIAALVGFVGMIVWLVKAMKRR